MHTYISFGTSKWFWIIENFELLEFELSRFHCMCIDIVEIWFWIANGQISSFLLQLSARHTSVFSFPDDYLSKYQWIFTKRGMCIDIVKIWFGNATGEFASTFDRVICPPQDIKLRGIIIFTLFIFMFERNWFLCYFFSETGQQHHRVKAWHSR